MVGNVAKVLRKRLKGARRHTGLSQRDFAVMMSVTTKTVQRWEDGHRVPRLLDLCRIATFSGLSLAWLLSDLDEARARLALEG